MVESFVGFVSEGADNVKLCASREDIDLDKFCKFLRDRNNKCIWKYVIYRSIIVVNLLYVSVIVADFFRECFYEGYIT